MKIAILTTSRADYGVLEKLIGRIHNDDKCELCLIVTGSHLSTEFNLTVNHIKYPIAEKIEMLLGADTETAICKALGLGCILLGDAFKRHNLDWLICLGDRFEMLAGALAAFNLSISVAHISGGELTANSKDDIFRHCITKLSYLHFTYHDEYRQRVIQLGESPDRVINVGCLPLEGIEKYRYYGKRQWVMVSYHPEVEGNYDIDILLTFLATYVDAPIVFIKSHGDAGSRYINKQIISFVEQYPRHVIESYGRPEYLRELARVKCLIGNSSSGIYEAPALGTPVINIGTRQEGRIKAGHVWDVDCRLEDLKRVYQLVMAYSGDGFRLAFHGGVISKTILNEIKRRKVINPKGFYDF